MIFTKKIITLIILVSFVGLGLYIPVAEAKKRNTYTTQNINVNKKYRPANKMKLEAIPAPILQNVIVIEKAGKADPTLDFNSNLKSEQESKIIESVKEPSNKEPSNFISVKEYILGEGDQINVTVSGEKAVSGEYKVGDDGAILMPWIGSISVKGLTLQQVLQQIENKLRDGYLKKPKVSVEMPVSRPFYVLGAVVNPGSYVFSHGISVLKAIEISGGFAPHANKKSVDVLRGNAAPHKPINMSLNDIIKSGDVIFVKEQPFN